MLLTETLSQRPFQRFVTATPLYSHDTRGTDTFTYACRFSNLHMCCKLAFLVAAARKALFAMRQPCLLSGCLLLGLGDPVKQCKLFDTLVLLILCSLYANTSCGSWWL